jgi:ankyrin repeat protein
VDIFDAIGSNDADTAVELVSEDPAVLSRTNQGRTTPILWALYTGKPDLARRLASAVPEVNVWEAAALGDAGQAQQQIQHEPQLVNAYSSDGFTPLQLAAFFGHAETVRTLIALGGDRELASTNPMRVRPVHAAAANQHLEVMRVLLESGADPNTQQEGGWTPLHEAANHSQDDLVTLLLAHGADPSIKADGGQTAYDISTASGRADPRLIPAPAV